MTQSGWLRTDSDCKYSTRSRLAAISAFHAIPMGSSLPTQIGTLVPISVNVLNFIIYEIKYVLNYISSNSPDPFCAAAVSSVALFRLLRWYSKNPSNSPRITTAPSAIPTTLATERAAMRLI